MVKKFGDVLRMPRRGYITPEGQVKKSTPSTKYSAAEVVESPTDADKVEMQKRQDGQEHQQLYVKNMTAAMNQADFEKSMASNPYLNKGGRKTRKSRKSRRRKGRRTRKH
jgi:hypothetical protein